jgi:magnesium transporter
MTRTRCYLDGTLHAEGFAVAEVSDHLAIPGHTVWFDICPPQAADLQTIREELGLHDLAVEDVLHPGQRPKLDHYPEHLFLVAYALDLDPDTSRLIGHEVGLFVTSNALVTVRADEGFLIDEVTARWDSIPKLASSGVAFLLYGVLDYAIDTQFEVVQALDAQIDSLEDQLFDDVTSDAALQRRTFEIRRSLVTLRRLVLPMREVVNTIMRPEVAVVDQASLPYYRDVHDHTMRVAEWTDSLRELSANILTTRLSVRSNRLNVITKKVTSWAAIIAVPTAVTGFYGQNLPYPGFAQHWGFWVSTVVIVTGSVGLYITFKVKDWL